MKFLIEIEIPECEIANFRSGAPVGVPDDVLLHHIVRATIAAIGHTAHVMGFTFDEPTGDPGETQWTVRRLAS